MARQRRKQRKPLVRHAIGSDLLVAFLVTALVIGAVSRNEYEKFQTLTAAQAWPIISYPLISPRGRRPFIPPIQAMTQAEMTEYAVQDMAHQGVLNPGMTRVNIGPLLALRAEGFFGNHPLPSIRSDLLDDISAGKIALTLADKSEEDDMNQVIDLVALEPSKLWNLFPVPAFKFNARKMLEIGSQSEALGVMLEIVRLNEQLELIRARDKSETQAQRCHALYEIELASYQEECSYWLLWRQPTLPPNSAAVCRATGSQEAFRQQLFWAMLKNSSERVCFTLWAKESHHPNPAAYSENFLEQYE